MPRAPRRHGREVHRRRGHGRLRRPSAPRGRRAARGPRRDRDARRGSPRSNGELERDYGVALEVRIGVNTGEVVTGEAAGQRLVTGDAVNVAARLEQAAAPGEILLGERRTRSRGTRSRSSRSSRSRSRARPSRSRRTACVARRSRAPGFERRLDAPLVGRRDELARVRAAFDAAVDERRCRARDRGRPARHRQVPSRRARSPASSATRRQCSRGRCLPYGEGITYWPLREIFGAAGAEDELDAALAGRRAEDVFWAVRKALETRTGAAARARRSRTSTGPSRRSSTCSSTSPTGRATRRFCCSASLARSCSTRPGVAAATERDLPRTAVGGRGGQADRELLAARRSTTTRSPDPRGRRGKPALRRAAPRDDRGGRRRGARPVDDPGAARRPRSTGSPTRSARSSSGPP